MTEPGQPGPVAIIADCPDEAYLPSFIGSPSWQHYQQPEEPQEGTGTGPHVVDVICHLSPHKVKAMLLFIFDTVIGKQS